MGSLAGTLLAARLLIPTVGTHRTLLIFALSLAVIGAAGFLVASLPRAIAVASSLGVRPAAIGASVGVAGARVIDSVETQYQYGRVEQFPDGTRWLQLNEGEAIHWLYRPGSYLTGGFWDDFSGAAVRRRRLPAAETDRDRRRRRRHDCSRRRPLLPRHAR